MKPIQLKITKEVRLFMNSTFLCFVTTKGTYYRSENSVYKVLDDETLEVYDIVDLLIKGLENDTI